MTQKKQFMCSNINGTEAVAQRFSVKKMFLEILQNSKENTCARVSFLKKLQALGCCNYIKKETLAQVFSCEFCEFSSEMILFEKLKTSLKSYFLHNIIFISGSLFIR